MTTSDSSQKLLKRHKIFVLIFTLLFFAIVVGTVSVIKQSQTYSSKAASTYGGPCPNGQSQCPPGYLCQNAGPAGKVCVSQAVVPHVAAPANPPANDKGNANVGGQCGTEGKYCCNTGLGKLCKNGLTCQGDVCQKPPQDKGDPNKGGECGTEGKYCCNTGLGKLCKNGLTCQGDVCQKPPQDKGDPNRGDKCGAQNQYCCNTPFGQACKGTALSCDSGVCKPTQKGTDGSCPKGTELKNAGFGGMCVRIEAKQPAEVVDGNTSLCTLNFCRKYKTQKSCTSVKTKKGSEACWWLGTQDSCIVHTWCKKDGGVNGTFPPDDVNVSDKKAVKNARDQIDDSYNNIEELKTYTANNENQKVALEASIKANQRIINVDKKIIKNPKDSGFISRAHNVISAYNKMYRLAGELYQNPDNASKKTALKNAEAAADKLYTALMASKPKDDDPANTTPPAIPPPATPDPGSVGFPPAGGGGGGGTGGTAPAPAPDAKTPTKPTELLTVCIQDVKTCPDGSQVGRTGPNCEFVCPGGTTDKGDVTLNLKLRFQGITKQPKDNSMKVKVSLDSEHQSTGTFTADSTGVWTGEVKFTKVDLNQKHSIFVKGPKHLQKRICVASPTELTAGIYSCSTNEITLKEGVNAFNLTNILLLAGDLPEQDGVVDSSDISFVVVNLGSTDLEDLEIGDVNLDGVINTQDYSLVIAALAIKTDDPVN